MLSLADRSGFSNAPFRSAERERHIPDDEVLALQHSADTIRKTLDTFADRF